MNKDEALRCFNMGKEAYNDGNFKEALKLFKKSYGMEKSDITQAFIHKCEQYFAANDHTHHEAPPQKEEEHKHHQTHHNNREHHHGKGHHQAHHAKEEAKGAAEAKEAPKDNGASTEAEYTQEQVDDINRLLKKKDFYEILGVSRTATEDELKKAYRKLALKFHPDKCRAPKAHEAFTKVGQAYDCLTNKDKRDYYDQHGNESPEQQYQHYSQHFHYEEFDPEDIFAMFFGMPPGQRRRRGQQRTQQYYYYSTGGGGDARAGGQQAPKNKFAYLLQLLPLLFILFFSLASNFRGEEEQIFALHRTQQFYMQRQTKRLQTPYYVAADFGQKHAKTEADLRKIESHVEETYARALYNQCQNEKLKKERLLVQARWSYGSDRTRLFSMAEQVDLSSCDDYMRIASFLGIGRW